MQWSPFPRPDSKYFSMFRCQNRSIVLIYILGFLKEGTVTSHYLIFFPETHWFWWSSRKDVLYFCFRLSYYLKQSANSLWSLCFVNTSEPQSKFLERNQTHEITIVNYKANDGYRFYNSFLKRIFHISGFPFFMLDPRLISSVAWCVCGSIPRLFPPEEAQQLKFCLLPKQVVWSPG